MDAGQMQARFREALALGGDVYGPDDVLALVREGRMQTFSSDDAFALTEVIQYPRKRVLNLYLASGSLDAIPALHAEVEAFARGQGCQMMVGAGRRGWTPLAHRLGWRTGYAGFLRELEG